MNTTNFIATFSFFGGLFGLGALLLINHPAWFCVYLMIVGLIMASGDKK